MPIRVTCPSCGKGLTAPDTLAGRRARCSNCRTPISVPAAEGPWDEEAAAAFLSEGIPPHSPAARASFPPVSSSASDVAPSPSDDSTFVPVPRERSRRRRRTFPVPPLRRPRGSSDQYLVCLFALTLLPLTFSLLSDGSSSDVRERWERTFEKHPELVGAEDAFKVLPGHRIEGAHLAKDSWLHWGYALVSAAGFFGLITALFPRGNAEGHELLWVGLFTATGGILLLLAIQWIASLSFGAGMWIRGRGVIALVFYLIKFIGFSYYAALRPDTGFLLSLIGFTFGVGLCEELVKAIPLIWHFKTSARIDWRGACIWGLASGVGFGVAEGIMYSSDFYNGVYTIGVYIVRFVSCVALHAVWSASVGLVIAITQPVFEESMAWGEWLLDLGKILGVPMILHALYDTMLKKDMNAAALIVALLSFVWLVGLMEFIRRGEEELNRPRARAAIG